MRHSQDQTWVMLQWDSKHGLVTKCLAIFQTEQTQAVCSKLYMQTAFHQAGWSNSRLTFTQEPHKGRMLSAIGADDVS